MQVDLFIIMLAYVEKPGARLAFFVLCLVLFLLMWYTRFRFFSQSYRTVNFDQIDFYYEM